MQFYFDHICSLILSQKEEIRLELLTKTSFSSTISFTVKNSNFCYEFVMKIAIILDFCKCIRFYVCRFNNKNSKKGRQLP